MDLCDLIYLNSISMMVEEILIIFIVTERASFLRVNFINSKTSQNQMNSSHNSRLAIDGNTETCSITELNSMSEEHPWWRVELDRVYNITNLTISYISNSSYSNFMNNWNIYVSRNAQNFEENLCISFHSLGNILSGQIQLKCQNPVAGKFVSIKRVGGLKKKTLILCDVQLETYWNTENLAFGRPTIESGRILKGKAEFAVDGNLDTCAAFKSNDNQYAWWRVILDDRYYVTNVSVYFIRNLTGISAWKHITAYVSNDKDYFEEHMCAFSSYPDFKVDKKRYIHLTCTRPILGTYVTIKKFGGNRPRWFIICEVEIFSSGAPREMNTSVASKECLDFEYKCHEGRCIHKEWLCDGTEDCPQGEDEGPSCQKCDEGKFKCARKNLCVNTTKKCDGNVDCPDHSDERGCFSIDFENGFLKANYHGESDFLICSHKWFQIYSFTICDELQNDYIKTRYDSIQGETTKLLNFDEDPKYPLLNMNSYLRGSRCESKKFVKIQCGTRANENTSLCGTRGFAEGDFVPYIINGENARDGAWPWYAQIFQKNFLVCGGSIINESWILTAAHCFKDIRSSELYVKVGTNVHDDPREPKFYVSHIASHPDYKKYDDVALMRLKSPIKFTKFIRPICLPKAILPQRRLMSFRYCVLSGFGRTSRSENDVPKYLQQARMNILDDIECEQHLKEIDPEPHEYENILEINNLLCAGTIPTLHGANGCEGDSGSALVCKDENRKWTQVGITKSNFEMKGGAICSNSIFTKVDRYLEFIAEVLSKNYKTDPDKSKACRSPKIIILAILLHNVML